MYLVACDPGTKYCAFAIFEEKHLKKTYKIKSSFIKLKEFFSQIEDDYIFAVEDQYLNLNVKTLKMLVEVRTTVLTLAKVYNAANCLVIAPQKWQKTILGVNIRAKREQRKRVSCMVASDIAKEKIADDDIADAICIGGYVQRSKYI